MYAEIVERQIGKWEWVTFILIFAYKYRSTCNVRLYDDKQNRTTKEHYT